MNQSQSKILELLRTTPEPLSIREIAQKLEYSFQIVCSNLKTMEYLVTFDWKINPMNKKPYKVYRIK